MYYCYLLRSLSEKHLNQTYIGFTDDPIHRLKQHNGEIKGGAKFTSRGRPWQIVMVVSNFPNKIVALKFEWAWQNPFKSNFTKDEVELIKVPARGKKKYYTSIEFKMKVLNILLNSKVYDKIYLYIFLFEDKPNEVKFNNTKIIERVNGEESFKEAIKNKIYKYTDPVEVEEGDNEYADKCIICDQEITQGSEEISDDKESDEDSDSSNKEEKPSIVSCPFCKSKYHLFCLAEASLEKEEDELALIPKETTCNICTKKSIWSEWIKSISE